MSSLIICDGDQVTFNPMFGQRQVVPMKPAVISGTGIATILQRRMCVLGDEKRTQWPAQYFIPGYSPGTGMLSIESLDDSQIAHGTVSIQPLIVQGNLFKVRFIPQVLAMMTSPPGTPDTSAPGMGTGSFIPLQTFVRAKG
jgi:hypothetical protein